MSNRSKRLLNRKAFKAPIASPSHSPAVPASVDVPLSSDVQKKKVRGSGKVPAGELYSIRLAPDLMTALRSRATSEARPVSEVVRLALQAYLVSPESND